MTFPIRFEYIISTIGNEKYGMGWTDTCYTGSLNIPQESTLQEIKYYGQTHLKTFLSKHTDDAVIIKAQYIIDLSWLGCRVTHIIENEMLNGSVIRLDGGLRMQAK